MLQQKDIELLTKIFLFFRYVEAHLAVKVGHLRRQQQIRSGSQPGGHPYYKPYKLSGQQVKTQILHFLLTFKTISVSIRLWSTSKQCWN